jgi:hypothetical protein
MEFGLVHSFIDHLQVVTTNNYYTIAISTLYSSLEHTVYYSHSVTRRFLLTAPTMAIPLPPGSSPLFTDSRTELTELIAPIVFSITPRHEPRRNSPFPTVPLLLLVDSLLRERVYQAVA